jgi:hypothetical protein
MLVFCVLQTSNAQIEISFSPQGYSLNEAMAKKDAGDPAEVDVILKNFTAGDKYAGFTLKIDYDSSVIHIADASQGAFFGTDYFGGDISVVPLVENWDAPSNVFGQIVDWTLQTAQFTGTEISDPLPDAKFTDPSSVERLSLSWVTAQTDDASLLIAPDKAEEIFLTLRMTIIAPLPDPPMVTPIDFAEAVLFDTDGNSIPITVIDPPKNFSLPVVLSMLTAVSYPSGIEVVWEAESQRENLGWNVYRSESIDGQFEKVNTKVIEGDGTTSVAKTYKFVDSDAQKGKSYFYYLESIAFDGETEKSDIVEVKFVNTSISWGAIKKLATQP